VLVEVIKNLDKLEQNVKSDSHKMLYLYLIFLTPATPIIWGLHVYRML